MGVEAAFADGVTPAAFVEDHLSELYEPWAEEFAKVSDVPVTVGLRLQGAGGGEWTLYVDGDELDVESGRGATPAATFVGDAKFWEVLRPELASTGRIEVGGNVGLTMKLAGAFL